MPGVRPSIIDPAATPLADTELLARLFRTLGDATRLRVLELLLVEGELHQMEIVRRLGVTQARVSEHMACLVWCGFVEVRIEGRRALSRDEPAGGDARRQSQAVLGPEPGPDRDVPSD